VNPSSYQRIWKVVKRIPPGKVATYGQVARLAGLGGGARLVGYALHALPDDERTVPWQRVINAQGRISPRGFNGAEELQRKLLAREGIRFDARARVDLARFGWKGR
jgi:methylated-DNA-protein-cysteine methyltransferase related protein